MTTANPPAAEARIAGAPISWGVCEVPGWGYQLGPERVLAEMREVGLTATEFGPDGFLPAYRAELAAFTEVVAGRRPSPCTVADALEAGWIAEACTLSLREHRPVRVSEVKQ